MKSSFPIFFSIVAILLISGCIQMDVKQTIMSDGNSRIELVYGLSGIAELSDRFGTGMGGMNVSVDTAGLQENFTKACGKFYEETEWRNPSCTTTEDFQLMMSGDVPLLGTPALQINPSFPYTTYRYDAKHVFSMLNEIGDPQGQDFSDAELQKSKAAAKMFGIELNYELQMPGTITRADLGDISGNTVKMDIFDMAGKDHVYVESQELNLTWLGFGLVGFLIAMIAGLLFRRRSSAGM